AEEYLKIYGKNGGLDRRIVAEASIGQILWRQSCTKGLLYDSCITIKRKKAQAGDKAREAAQKLKQKAKKVNDKKASGSSSKKQEIPEFFGSATSGTVTVHDRNKKKAEEAQKYFDSVLKLAKITIKVP